MNNSRYIVCYIVNTIFGTKTLYKHFDFIDDVIDFVQSKTNDLSVLDAFVYKNIES